MARDKNRLPKIKKFASVDPIRLNGFPDNIPKLLDGVLVPRQSVTLRVVEHVGGVWVTDVVESQRPMDIGVQGANCDSVSKQECVEPPGPPEDTILTDMAGRYFNHGLGLVAQDHAVAVGINRWPTGKEDGIFEHGLNALLLKPSLLVEQKRGGHRCAFRVTDDGVKRASFLHDLDEKFEGVVCAPVCRCDTFSHQLPHGILGCFAVGKLSDPRQDVVLLRLLDILVRLDEPEIWWFAKVLLEAFGRDRLARPVDEVEGGGSVLGQLFDNRRCLGLAETGRYSLEGISYPAAPGTSFRDVSG